MRFRRCASISTLIAAPVWLAFALSGPAAAKYEDPRSAKAAQIAQHPDGAQLGARLAGVVDDSVSRRFTNRSVARPTSRPRSFRLPRRR